MKVLVACEFSGIVRDAFIERGHDAISCDLLPTERPGPHYQGDVRDMFCTEHDECRFDLMIVHPPCTDLAVSGARWFAEKQADGRQWEALEFVRMLLGADVDRIALENPVSIISSRIRKPDQIIQPYEYGHPERKATCLWLKGLPKLVPTNDVRKQMAALPLKDSSRVHYASPGPDRWKERSRTLPGVAAAFAEQWGQL